MKVQESMVDYRIKTVISLRAHPSIVLTQEYFISDTGTYLFTPEMSGLLDIFARHIFRKRFAAYFFRYAPTVAVCPLEEYGFFRLS